MTREDIVRAGRGASPWEFIPLALAALRVVPQDAEIRFLLSAAYAKLGLRTPAAEQMALLPDSVAANSGVGSLRALIDGLADDRLSVATLTRTLHGNLATLRARGEGSLDGSLDAWTARAHTREWFRAFTGDVLWRRLGDVSGWERFDQQREPAASLALPHDESPAAATYPPWYSVDGIDPPWMLERLGRSTSGRNDEYAPHLLLTQCDPLQALDGLAQQDLSGILADPRLLCFFGSDAATRVRDFLSARSRDGSRVACAAIGLPTTTPRLHPPVQVMVDVATTTASALEETERNSLATFHENHDRDYWSRRFVAAASGSEPPLRVLIPTSRFSTFLRHSAADLADALTHAGCQARVFLEPDAHTLLEPLATLRACADFQPDLIIIPNYLRASVTDRLPARVPMLTWVQDAMPQLFSPDAGRAMGELDFIAGNLREQMFQSFGYPRSRALHAPMAASTRKFHPGPVTEDLHRRHDCDIAYVSHHSQPPEALHQRRLAEAAALPRGPELLAALFPRILDIIRSPLHRGPLSSALRSAALEELRRLGLPDSEPALASLLTSYVHPVADRALRHHTLDSAARLAARRGWRMHLYGKGWETHPTLSSMARGELAHGDDLRACYQVARTHLHISLHTAIHQRVFECALSGGLPLCRLQADDLSQLEYLAAAHACRAGARPLADIPSRPTARGYRSEPYAIDACPESRRYAAFVQALGLEAPQAVWLNSVHAERLLSSLAERIDGEGESLWDLWPDPAALMFHDQATLERVMARAIEDNAWRHEQSTALSEQARRTVSYDALASRLISFTAAGLSAVPGRGDARWYDSPGRTPPGAQPART